MSLYDAQNGTGNLLSTGTRPQVIVPGTSNTVQVIFNGVPASAFLSIGPTQLVSGSASSAQLIAIVKDADGNIIVGPGNYQTPIAVSSSDTSGATLLSSSTITAPGQAITVTYNGVPVTETVTFKPSVSGLTATSLASTMLMIAQAAQNGPNQTGQTPDNANAVNSVPTAGPALTVGGLPSKVDLASRMAPIQKQGSELSCVAWAVGYAMKSYAESIDLNGNLTLSNGQFNPSTTFSPAFIYNQINNGRDHGSSFIDALNLLATQGAALWSDMPYVDGQYLAQPPGSAFTSAYRFRSQTYQRLGIPDIKSKLANGQVVVAGFIIDDAFESLGPNQVWSGPAGRSYGGHAMAIVGYDDSLGAYKLMNSWGTNWGTNGFGFVSYNYAPSVIEPGQVYVSKDVVQNSATPPPASVTPAPIPSPTIAITNTQFNIQLPAGNGLETDGTLTVAPGLGNIAVIATYFFYNDGNLTPVPSQISTYSDGLGDAAAITPSAPVLSGFSGNWYTRMPYAGLNPLAHATTSYIAVSAVFIDGYFFGIATPTLFTVTSPSIGGGIGTSSVQRAPQSLIPQISAKMPRTIRPPAGATELQGLIRMGR